MSYNVMQWHAMACNGMRWHLMACNGMYWYVLVCTYVRMEVWMYVIGNWCDSLHVTAFHLRFSPQVLGYHLECSQISHFPLPAAKLFPSSPVPFWVPDMSFVGISHDIFGAPHKWIGVTCPKHCYLRGFRHLTPFHSKTWIALVASCGDPWDSQFLWVALFRIRDLGRPWEPQNVSLNIATKIQIHVMAMIDFQGISLQKPRPTEAENC